MSSIISRQSKSRSRTPSPAKSTRSVLNVDSLELEDPVESDLRIIHAKEKAVFTLNDELCALTSVIKNETNEQAMTENMNRKRKMRLIDYQDELDARSASVSKFLDEYKETAAHRDESRKLFEYAQSELVKLNAGIDQALVNMEELVSEENEIQDEDPELREELETLRTDVRILNYSMMRRRDYVSEGMHLQTNKAAIFAEADQTEARLNPMKNDLLRRLSELHERSLIATKTINLNPSDNLTEETRFVNELEDAVKHLEGQLESTVEDDEYFGTQIDQPRQISETFSADIAARKKKLTIWKASMQNEADAIDRRINKADKMTTGTSIASSMANIQQKLAQTLVDNIFKKLEDRRRAVDVKHQKIDKMQEEHKLEREKRQEEYEQKMKKVLKLSEAYDIYEKMYVNVQADIGDIDNLKKRVIDLDFQSGKAKRLNAICEVNAHKIAEEAERLAPLKQDLEKREKEAEEYENKIAEERARVQTIQASVDEKEAHAKALEEQTDKLEDEAKQLQIKLESLVTQIDKQYQAFTSKQAKSKSQS